MPRVSGIYARPTGIDAVANNTIDSGKYNSNVADVEADLNLPRPIVAGGTGASDATGARDNLDAERATQVVTNFDAHVWEAGSFSAANTATGSPVAGHNFTGIAYQFADPLWMFVEARDINDTTVPARKYIRYRNNGVWGPWVAETNMSGLTISDVNPTIVLDTSSLSGTCQIVSRTTGVLRWALQLGDSTPETGSNVGSDFAIWRYGDAGVTPIKALTINRASGDWLVEGRFTVGPWIGAGAGFGRIDLKCTAGAFNTAISYINGVTTRWTTTCGGTGDDFLIDRFNDAGAAAGTPLSISRATGQISIPTAGAGSLSTTWGGAAVRIGFVAGSGGISFRPTADGGYPCLFANAADAGVGYITTSATTTTYATSSDERLKEDLKPAALGSSQILDATNVYDFKWKSTQERAYGVIAQQAKDVYPTAVSEKDDRFFIDYSKYVPILIQEAKTLRTRIATLEALIGTSPMATILQRLDVLDKFREKIEAL